MRILVAPAFPDTPTPKRVSGAQRVHRYCMA